MKKFFVDYGKFKTVKQKDAVSNDNFAYAASVHEASSRAKKAAGVEDATSNVFCLPQDNSLLGKDSAFPGMISTKKASDKE